MSSSDRSEVLRSDVRGTQREKGRPLVILLANTSWYLFNFRKRLAEDFIGAGVDVVFLAPADKYTDRLARIAPFIPLNLDRKGCNPITELGTLFRLSRNIHEIKPDAVLTWTSKPNIYGALAGRLLNIPVIPNVTGLGFAFVNRNWLTVLIGGLYRYSLRRCPVVFFQNAHDQDEFIRAGWIQRGRDCLLPGSGVDLTRFSLRPFRNESEFVFLFAGRLLRDKGLHELVSAAKLLKGQRFPIRVRFAGSVDPGNPASISFDEIQSWTEEGIEFVGHSDDVKALIDDADCVVLPSYYREGVPRILLEAAASGRPVITTDTPGCRDAVIPEKTGLLCNPRDTESLLNAMRRMIVLPTSERAAMGLAAREYMEKKFSEKIVIDAYLNAVRGILGKKGEADEASSAVRSGFVAATSKAKVSEWL